MKPLGYYTNTLPDTVETTELSQPQLRELIALLLNAPNHQWYYTPQLCPNPFPNWVTDNWTAIKADATGVIQWAVQYLDKGGAA